jgi:glycosyltransferase involved in cell wall biosynthesis
MTRILFVEQFSELGGGQRNLLDLLPAVMERGWKATVAAPGTASGDSKSAARSRNNGQGGLLEKAQALGAETARIGIGNYSAGRKTPAEAARFLIDTIALGRWISRQDFDLISVGGARLMPAVARGAVAVRDSKKSPRPVVFQAQHFLGKAYAVAMTARAIRRAQATVIANSDYVASQYRGSIGADRVHVVYNGVAEIPFAERWGSTIVSPQSERPWRIGLIGRIAAMKGQADFLRAAKVISRESPNVKFAICGTPMFTPQAYVDEVYALAEGLPVEFLGWREDVGAVLADLDLLVAPSSAAEATTRVILEAFSAGVPVVAYAAGGIPEIVRDGDNGFLVPECEPGALARKILEVVRMDLSGVAKRARCDWERRFTIARYQREMTELMGRVMSGG